MKGFPYRVTSDGWVYDVRDGKLVTYFGPEALAVAAAFAMRLNKGLRRAP